MTLFVLNNIPLEFNLIRLNDEELIQFTDLIVNNGGKVGYNKEFSYIKFTTAKMGSSIKERQVKLYDVQFFKDCVAESRIVDYRKYRLRETFPSDNCLVSHFLFGRCCFEGTDGELNNKLLETEHRAVQTEIEEQVLIGNKSNNKSVAREHRAVQVEIVGIGNELNKSVATEHRAVQAEIEGTGNESNNKSVATEHRAVQAETEGTGSEANNKSLPTERRGVQAEIETETEATSSQTCSSVDVITADGKLQTHIRIDEACRIAEHVYLEDLQASMESQLVIPCNKVYPVQMYTETNNDEDWNKPGPSNASNNNEIPSTTSQSPIEFNEIERCNGSYSNDEQNTSDDSVEIISIAKNKHTLSKSGFLKSSINNTVNRRKASKEQVKYTEKNNTVIDLDTKKSIDKSRKSHISNTRKIVDSDCSSLPISESDNETNKDPIPKKKRKLYITSPISPRRGVDIVQDPSMKSPSFVSKCPYDLGSSSDSDADILVSINKYNGLTRRQIQDRKDESQKPQSTEIRNHMEPSSEHLDNSNDIVIVSKTTRQVSVLRRIKDRGETATNNGNPRKKLRQTRDRFHSSSDSSQGEETPRVRSKNSIRRYFTRRSDETANKSEDIQKGKRTYVESTTSLDSEASDKTVILEPPNKTPSPRRIEASVDNTKQSNVTRRKNRVNATTHSILDDSDSEEFSLVSVTNSDTSGPLRSQPTQRKTIEPDYETLSDEDNENVVASGSNSRKVQVRNVEKRLKSPREKKAVDTKVPIDKKPRPDPKSSWTHTYRLNFSNTERRKMIDYLIATDRIGEAKGLNIWRNMINDGILVNRTPYSLQNHFLKHILPYVNELHLEEHILEQFTELITNSKKRNSRK